MSNSVRTELDAVGGQLADLSSGEAGHAGNECASDVGGAQEDRRAESVLRQNGKGAV